MNEIHEIHEMECSNNSCNRTLYVKKGGGHLIYLTSQGRDRVETKAQQSHQSHRLKAPLIASYRKIHTKKGPKTMTDDPTLFDDNPEPDPLPPVPWWARDLPLIQAQEVLRGLLDDGAHCPCCGQPAKIYKRRVNSGMARSLIKMWQKAGLEWIYIPTEIGARSREEGKLAYWSLAEEATEKRDDGGRAGWWRVTPLGRAFVLGMITVPKYARVYNQRCLGFEGDQIRIWDALKSRFDYRALMDGQA